MFDLIFADWSEIIKWIVIVAAVVFVLIALIKYKHARPILVALLCFGWLGLGCWSGITLYQYSLTKNQVIGTPTVHDPYEGFDFFEYDLGNIVWYQNSDGEYEYSEIYGTTTKFEGGINKYELLVNNTPCDTTTSANARLHGELIKRFKDIDGNVTDVITFKIDFTFESSRITVKITNNATIDNIQLVREFVAVNGFNLRIINSVYTSG